MDPPARDGFPSRIAHARQSGPAEAVVPGSALRAAVISNCPAPGRRGRVGRGFPVAAWRYPGARGSRADETTASSCSVEACRDKHRPVPSPPDRLSGTELARGVGLWDCEGRGEVSPARPGGGCGEVSPAGSGGLTSQFGVHRWSLGSNAGLSEETVCIHLLFEEGRVMFKNKKPLEAVVHPLSHFLHSALSPGPFFRLSFFLQHTRTCRDGDPPAGLRPP